MHDAIEYVRKGLLRKNNSVTQLAKLNWTKADRLIEYDNFLCAMIGL